MARRAQPRPTDLMDTTGGRLTSLMRQRGLTTPALAATLRIQQSTLDNFRQGYRSIPSDVLDNMARELGTNTDYLMERSDDSRPSADIREEARLRSEARRSP
jgi:transcriptional regulator with XRE-family HTH domain